MTEKSININIWDDYSDDECVMGGKVQETYAYIESEIPNEDCKNILESFQITIEELAKQEWSLEMHLNYYDAAKVYPGLVGTENEYCLYKHWRLEIKNLTHQAREYLVEKLENKKLKYHEAKIVVYSES